MNTASDAQLALPNFCPQCGAKRPEPAQFCPGCGNAFVAGATAATPRVPRKLAPLSVGKVALLLVVSSALLAVGWSVNSSFSGTKPTESFEDARARNERARMNPALIRLREAAEAAPGDVLVWKALADALLAEMQAAEKPSSTLVFETIDALRKILDLNPDDAFALINMADISLNQQVFEKAVSYYERYLAITPKDHISRARYASALAFMGKADAAVEQLQIVLKEDPNNFHALAYLAVTHAQSGDKKQAREIGQRALQYAPSAEARERFNEFLSSLSAEDQASASAPMKGPSVVSARGGSAGGIAAIDQFVRGNQVAGSKFLKAELREDAIVLTFKDFPMEKMPPFVRDKFAQSIIDQAKQMTPQVRTIVFVDAESSAEMWQATVN